MASSAQIRHELPVDVDGIRHVHQLAFPSHEEAAIVDRLRGADRLTISLVAELGEEVVGHCALSPVTIDQQQVGLGLAPVAVVPDYQRLGIGGDLVRQGLSACRESGVPLVVVLGSPGYYSRFGFVSASAYGLQDTYGGGAAFQAIILDDDRSPPSGLVHYASEFGGA